MIGEFYHPWESWSPKKKQPRNTVDRPNNDFVDPF